MLRLSGPDRLAEHVGMLGHSAWKTVEQDRVNAFAGATDDPQWIHVDPERAAGGPFSGPIAHGFLSLSLLSSALQDVLVVEGTSMLVNYGFDRVRFLQPVPVGARIRFASTLLSVEPGAKGYRATARVTAEVEGEPKPALIADWIVLYVPAEAQPQKAAIDIDINVNR